MMFLKSMKLCFHIISRHWENKCLLPCDQTNSDILYHKLIKGKEGKENEKRIDRIGFYFR